MKNKKNFNPFFRVVLLLTVVLIVIVITALALLYYVFYIPEPEGASKADWPRNFTNDFSVWASFENGEVEVERIGLDRLDEYGLWIQFIDESGREIFSHNKPGGYPEKYSSSELIEINSSEYKDGYTVFADRLDDSCGYIIGFPYDIGKYALFYNGGRVARLSPVVGTVIFTFLGVLVFSALAYGFWISRKLSGITKGVENISKRSYEPFPETGMFGGIYGELNEMNREILRADRVSRETDLTRREWIANITHDLKTPLSPIKGYAEALADGSADEETTREYGAIIQKNADHAERLINDLKLTYQLESGSSPYNPKEVLIERLLREWIIDIINDPAFSNRDISFESRAAGVAVNIDEFLFRRAATNIIINALAHNTSDVKVNVTLDEDSDFGVRITVRDNGIGMSDEALQKLFERYYRGTSTKEKPEGSGLGLAIAKQIIELHGGDITVKSQIGIGTEFTIRLPYKN